MEFENLAGIIDEVARWKVVRTVDNDIPALDDLQSIPAGECQLEALNGHMRVDVGEPLTAGHHLGLA